MTACQYKAGYAAKFVKAKAVIAAVLANFVAMSADAQTSIVQSNVGSGCSSVCINGDCKTTCNGVVTETSSAMKGNGDIQEKDIELNGFKFVSVTDLSTTIQQGETSSVKVVADSNLLDKVLVKQEGDTLVAKLENGHYSNATITLEIVMPDLSRIEQTGANTLTFSGFDQSDLQIQVNGSGTTIGNDNIVSNLKLFVNGAGEVDLRGTEVAQVSLRVDGTGSVRLNFDEATRAGTAEIVGSINGVATVGVCGEPKNSVQINGIADFSHIDC
ncbi:MAG: DUF2807 domain-containing protein [Acidiferrobacterales bacterium]|nr:DUF2807 domain-containing protein [Acidiferrobacterales bacterium]